MVETESVDDVIKRTYFNISGDGGAYIGPRKLHATLKRKGGIVPSVYKIRKWMQSNDTYNLLKPVRRRYKRSKVVVSEPYEMFDIDLADVSSLSSDNDSFQFLLIVIDIFTRKLWVEILKDKKGKEIVAAMKRIFQRGTIPKKIRSDSGAEFKNRWFSALMKQNNIYHHITLNTTVKANYAERVNLISHRQETIDTLITFKISLIATTPHHIDR